MITRHSSLLRSANLGWQLREACGAILVVVMLAIIVPGVATGQSGGSPLGAPQPAD